MAFRMEETHFSQQRENRVYPQNDVTCARNLLQKIRCCLPDPTMSSLTLAQSVQELVDHNFTWPL